MRAPVIVVAVALVLAILLAASLLIVTETRGENGIPATSAARLLPS